ncbi:MAG: hypothetical protein ACPG45_08235 [Flavobacteriaceae bacterium]
MKQLLYIFIMCTYFYASSQVGIGTTTPTETLDVIGSMKLSEKLFLENPSAYTEIRGSKFLISTATNEILNYDLNISKYGPINFVAFEFEDLNTSGLLDYDTKISVSKYTVSLQGYSYVHANGGPAGTSVYFKSATALDNVYGLTSQAYKKNGTWWLQFYVDSSKFYNKSHGNINVDLFINTIIFRNDLLLSQGNTITVNMGNTTTATASLPTGY